MDVTAKQVVDTWREAGPAKWFAKDEAFDRVLARDFATAHHAAARGELDDWAKEDRKSVV